MSSGDFVHVERVRFRDLDPMGHVNNAVFLTYLEQARVALFSELEVATGLEEMNMIVARVEIDFKAPVRLGQEVEISVRPSRFACHPSGCDLRPGRRNTADVTNAPRRQKSCMPFPACGARR